MNQRQKAFCDVYIATLNATESAEKAGYSKKTAYSIGQRLLKNVEVKKYLQKMMQKADKSRIATAEEVLEYLTMVVRNKREKTSDRTKAAELLGKRYAIFAEKIESDATVRVIMDKKTEEYSG